MDTLFILEAIQKFVHQEKFVQGVLESALKRPEANKKDILDASQIVRDIFNNKLESILYAVKTPKESRAFVEELQEIRFLVDDKKGLLEFVKRWMGEG